MSEPRYPYVHVTVPADEAELVSDQLWTLDAQGVEERDATTLLRSDDADQVLLVASFATEEEAHRVVAQLAHPAKVEFVVGDEWRDAWREYFHPRKVGPRLLLRPSWREVTPEPGDVVLTIDPGGAFGSGIHETTRLVLAEVDTLVNGGEHVLDVGCGSGILAVAALLLGAKEAYGTDVDPTAVPVAIENAEHNGVADRFRADTADIADVTGEWPIVLANIQAPILIAMAPALSARLAPNGVLVLSGILSGQDEGVREAFEAQGLTHLRTTSENEWRGVVMQRPA
ncbi:MAG: 50S ribosomal protein L11 methyltransferase [Sandaracinus sp.]|nr:50S ribosomal protein L11 methyltransferase [Sandaracinus sp.]